MEINMLILLQKTKTEFDKWKCIHFIIMLKDEHN